VLASANVFFISALTIRYCVPTDGAARPAVFSPTKQKHVTPLQQDTFQPNGQWY
jgi:hypothetical protein